MGGFFIAQTMQKWDLHRRIALYIIRIIGDSPRKMALGFMVATAFLSMMRCLQSRGLTQFLKQQGQSITYEYQYNDDTCTIVVLMVV